MQIPIELEKLRDQILVNKWPIMVGLLSFGLLIAMVVIGQKNHQITEQASAISQLEETVSEQQDQIYELEEIVSQLENEKEELEATIEELEAMVNDVQYIDRGESFDNW